VHTARLLIPLGSFVNAETAYRQHSCLCCDRAVGTRVLRLKHARAVSLMLVMGMAASTSWQAASANTNIHASPLSIHLVLAGLEEDWCASV
jgi:hypothetical protein